MDNDNAVLLLRAEFDVFEGGFKASFQLAISDGKDLAGGQAVPVHILIV